MILEVPSLYAAQTKYRKSAKGKAAKARYQARFQKTANGKMKLAIWQTLYRLKKSGVPDTELLLVKSALSAFYMSDQVCPIFKKPMKEIGGHAADHDHETKKFRGIISRRANSVLGLVYDNPEVLRRLADYLEQRQATRLPNFEPAETKIP